MTAAAARAAPVAKSEPARSTAARPGQGGTVSETASVGNLLEQLHARGLRANLEVGGAGDPEEREADRFADAVMGGTKAPCACGGTCSKCSGSGGGGVIRRKAEGAPAAAATVSRAFRGPGRNLDLATRARFEPRAGLDLSRVRVHNDDHAATTASAIGARAYTVGNNIGFARGAYNPGTAVGQRLLAHELGHIALGHGGTRRKTDMEFEYQAARVERQEAAAKARQEKHVAWDASIDKKWGSQLGSETSSLSDERAKLNMSITGLQAKAFDLAGADDSWLQRNLKAAGYAGPTVAEVKKLWGTALVDADAMKIGADAKQVGKTDAAAGVPPEVRLQAMTDVPAYYEAAKTFGAAVETALKTWADEVNAVADAKYRTDLAAYNQVASAQKSSCRSEPKGDGGGAFCAGMAIARGSPPQAPSPVTIPAPVSIAVDQQSKRAETAQSPAEWGLVAADLQASGMALGRLMVASLSSSKPEQKDIQDQAAQLEALDSRLAKFASEYTYQKRVPAIFYPQDAGRSIKSEDGVEQFVADAVPWQFYLVYRASTDEKGMCGTTGEWALIDLTNSGSAENKIAASGVDTDKLAKGEWPDPPIDLFTPLNSKLRFPEGKLFFKLPSGTSYVHHMTEPWELSDYLSAIGTAFMVAGMIASIVMTAGATTPLVLGAAAGVFGVGATLAGMEEKKKQGLLTDADVNRAMFEIGLNVISIASMGMGKLLLAPGAAARFGSGFAALVGAFRVLKVAEFGANVIQATLVTEDLVAAFVAIKNNPKLDDETRTKMIAQLAGRALVTGVMTVISLRGSFVGAKEAMNIKIEEPALPGSGEKPLANEAETAKPAVDPANKAQVHDAVSPTVEKAGQTKGTGVMLESEAHALGVAGSGEMRDIYFCSDLCTTASNRIGAVLEALPENHPMRPALEDMLKTANQARGQLKSGKMTAQEGDAIAKSLRDRLGKLTADSNHGTTLSTLFDMNPEVVSGTSADLRKGIAKGLDIKSVRAEAEAEFAPVPTPDEALLQQGGGRRPRGPQTWKEAGDDVMDAKTRALLPDFDRRVSTTGNIKKIRAGYDKEGALGVTIEGNVEPGKLSRNPDRVAAGATKAPSFNSQLRSKLGGLKELGLKGWQRLHLWGPGFGDEAAAGMFLGPESINQIWQNGDVVMSGGKTVRFGIEGYIRELSDAAKASGGRVSLKASATAWPDPSPGGFKAPQGEPVLRSVQYKIELIAPDGSVAKQTTVDLSLSDPITWTNPSAVKPVVTISGDASH